MTEQDTRGDHEDDLTVAFFAGAGQSAFLTNTPSYVLVEDVAETGGSTDTPRARIMPDCACK